MSLHPSVVLFDGEPQPAVIPVCDHYCGQEKFMRKALELQAQTAVQGRAVFDVTLDCEDGAKAGDEANHARMVVELLNSPLNAHARAAVRIHDITHPHHQADINILLGGAAHVLSHVMLPKPRNYSDVARAIDSINLAAQVAKSPRAVPIHVLIETHGALREVDKIAAHPQVESISLGIMDFVSSYRGAVPASAMQSPGQYTHPLITRAKLEISSACHAHGKVPSESVTMDVKNPQAAADDALRAKNEFGFLRKWSIHPSQILPIVGAFAPHVADLALAQEILLQGYAANWGAIKHVNTLTQEHTLHDRASYRYYWQVLQRARQTGAALAADIEKAFFSHSPF